MIQHMWAAFQGLCVSVNSDKCCLIKSEVLNANSLLHPTAF